MANDVWWCWTATCTGTVTLSTCNLTTADTVIDLVSVAAATPLVLKAVAVTFTASGPVEVGPAMNEAMAWPLESSLPGGQG